LEDVPLDVRTDMYFQQDGCPAHNAKIVKAFLNDTFGEKWIGTVGPIPWPPRSKDLTCPDFFLWGYLKDKVYATESLDINDMKEKIKSACFELSKETLKNSTGRKLMERFENCMQEAGHQFEHLMQ